MTCARLLSRIGLPLDPHAVGAQRIHFLHECERIEHHAVADHAAASFAQHPARNELKDELLALDRYCVSGIVAARIARYDVEAFRENVNNLAFTFVAPLRADDDCCLAWFQLAAPLGSPDAAESPHAGIQICTQLAYRLRIDVKIQGYSRRDGLCNYQFYRLRCQRRKWQPGILLPSLLPYTESAYA